MSSLWRKVELDAHDKSPRSILEEQAEEFNMLYPDELHAKVDSQRSTDINLPFRFNFTISSTQLFYSYQLLDIYCPAKFYPLHIRLDPDLYFYDDPIFDVDEWDGFISVKNQEDYIAVLKKVFNSPDVNDIIRAVLIQSRESKIEDDEDLPF